jgi:hypothetical protein
MKKWGLVLLGLLVLGGYLWLNQGPKDLGVVVDDEVRRSVAQLIDLEPEIVKTEVPKPDVVVVKPVTKQTVFNNGQASVIMQSVMQVMVPVQSLQVVLGEDLVYGSGLVHINESMRQQITAKMGSDFLVPDDAAFEFSCTIYSSGKHQIVLSMNWVKVLGIEIPLKYVQAYEALMVDRIIAIGVDTVKLSDGKMSITGHYK